MSTIPLRIILHGLIALAPQNGPDGAKMTALLVDAQRQPAGMECFEAHKPEIRFPTTDPCPASAGCKLDGEDICLCKLNRQEIKILPQKNRNPLELTRTPSRSLPFTREEAGAYAYVASLSELGYRLAPGVLPADPPVAPVAPPSALVARFKFPFDTVAACGLATRRDDGADYAHAMNMRPLEREEAPNEMSQAMAQRVEATLVVDVENTADLKLVLSPFPGEAGQAREFTLLSDLGEVEIELSNDRPHFMEPDRICDDGIGRDFAFFYDLVENQPASWKDRPVPHVKNSVSKSIADLFPLPDPNLCKKRKAFMSRPICPMSSF